MEFRNHHSNHICAEHRYVSKRHGRCPVCKKTLVNIGYQFRVPRKNASQKKWNEVAKFELRMLRIWRRHGHYINRTV